VGERQRGRRMTDDTERYGATGGDRDSDDQQFLVLMQKAREQGLHLVRHDAVFYLADDADDVAFKTDKGGRDGLEAIGAFLIENDAAGA
jgi:hypothetical protein